MDELRESSVGCYWGGHFAGAMCYADDIVLLPPSASALRRMLSICVSYAPSHGLVFNVDKTQLICFHSLCKEKLLPVICFNDVELPYMDQVSHLGHIITYNLDDRLDIIRAMKDLNRKANSVLYKFSAADPFVNKIILSIFIWFLSLVPLIFFNQTHRGCIE